MQYLVCSYILREKNLFKWQTILHKFLTLYFYCIFAGTISHSPKIGNLSQIIVVGTFIKGKRIPKLHLIKSNQMCIFCANVKMFRVFL